MVSIVGLAALTGFVGDAFLQWLTAHGKSPGLVPYFKQHGRAESLFIAAGIMAIFFTVYSFFLPYNYLYLALFGAGADLAFRWTRVFPSLDGYYAYYSTYAAALYMAFSMVLPLLLYEGLVFYQTGEGNKNLK